MPEETQICEICRKNKVASSKASLTQWISTCVCDLEPVDSSIEDRIEVCQHCGKRVGVAKKGSLTQFIFKTDYCKCNRPTAKLDRKFDFYNPPKLEEEILLEEDLDVDVASYPSTRYKPLKLLGKGASGIVYLARDRNLNKNVSLKLLNTTREEHLIAFQEEAKATSKLNHQSIIKIIDFGIANEYSPYMVLEYFNGISLEELLNRNGTIEWHFAVAIIIELSKALSYSHSLGVFHRDIKPSNILVRVEDNSPQIRVIDFGVARLIARESDNNTLETSSGISLVGTQAYMSPDQLNGLVYDSCSEVYSIGCVLFELLTGTTPYVDDSSTSIIQCHLEDSVPLASDKVDIPPKLDAIITKCLSKEKQGRYESASQLELALNEVLESKTEQDFEPAILESTKTQNKPSKIFVPLVFIILLVIGLAIYSFLPKAQNSKKAEITKIVKPQKTMFHEAFKRKDSEEEIRLTAIGNIGDSDFKLIKETIKGNKPIELHILGQPIDGSCFKHLSGLPIESIKLRNCQLKDSNAHYLTKLSSLHSVSFSKMKVSNSYIKAFQGIKKLSTLDLKESKFEENFLESLFKSKRIRTVRLNDTTISDYTLSCLKNCLNLQELRLSNCPNITIIGFKHLLALKNLSSLEVIGTAGFDKAALSQVAQYPKLDTLQIGSVTSFKPEDLTLLGKSSSLKYLAIYDLKPISKYLKPIAKLKNITRLKLNDTDLTTKDFNELLKMTQLKVLVLNANPKINSIDTNNLKKSLPKSTKLVPDMYTVEESIGDVEQLFGQ